MKVILQEEQAVIQGLEFYLHLQEIFTLEFNLNSRIYHI